MYLVGSRIVTRGDWCRLKGSARRLFHRTSYLCRNPIEQYEYEVQQRRIKDDPYQRRIIGSLVELHNMLLSYRPPEIERPSIEELRPKSGMSRMLGSLFHKFKRDKSTTAEEINHIKGIYLYGDVGCGKTMLMDTFFKTIPLHLPKERVHFHQFMQNLHKRSHQLKLQHGNEDIDVIPLLATEIAHRATVLCFDELQVTDIADAMLLRRLLMLLLSPKYGVVLFATSNRAPDDLYINGIQRASFIPCIQQIKRQTKVIYLSSPTDYRKVPKPLSPVYYYPKPGIKWNSKTNQANCKRHIEEWYAYFNRENRDQTVITGYKLEVWGRYIHVPKCSPPHVAQFTFEELCGKPLAAGDYLTLASSFRSFIITDIPYLTINVRDLVRRFITFLDAVYDAHGRLAVTSAAAFTDLFVEPENLKADNYLLYKRQQDTGKIETFEDDDLVVKHGFDKSVAKKASMFANDEEKFAFARALSRLSQMSTTDWVTDEH